MKKKPTYSVGECFATDSPPEHVVKNLASFIASLSNDATIITKSQVLDNKRLTMFLVDNVVQFIWQTDLDA